eukprot:CAMPEP_0113514960 /NCGR_PEP_ID=MMETSP0014_2-20120614/40686_1 /TAXON_ID=2857 /ORGANISM="Nitzschia sp." /LENGTH=350 /DNA_ID=CAMNT_0000411489 /DNA_START=36 /DNA_END=1088 /DNA_ORIENTATION=+ /assembly_acc=CAM_ASM_000159
MTRNNIILANAAAVVAVALACACSLSFPTGVSSWIITSPPSTTRTRSISSTLTRSQSPTSLGMFDWLNPNKNKDNVDEKQEEGGGGGDFFSNLFKPMTQTRHETTTQTEPKEEISSQAPKELSVTSSSVEQEEEETIEVIAAAAVADKENTVVDLVVEDPDPVQVQVVAAEDSAVVKDEDDAKISPPKVAAQTATTSEAAAATAATPVSGSSSSASSSTDTDVQIHRGKVKYFDRRRGFGFIYPWVESDGSDNAEGGDKGHYSHIEKDLVFVHFSEVQTPPEPPVADTSNKKTKGKWFRTLFNREVVNYHPAIDEKGRKIAKYVTGPNGGDVVSIKKQKKVAQEQDPLSP